MTETKELSEFAAYIGIDWADEKHAWALHNPTQSVVEQGDLLHKPEAVAAWAAELARRFGERPIAIALEQSRGSLLFMLLKYKHFVVFPVHPSTLVNYCKGFRPSGAKSDPSDASLLVGMTMNWKRSPANIPTSPSFIPYRVSARVSATIDRGAGYASHPC